MNSNCKFQILQQRNAHDAPIKQLQKTQQHREEIGANYTKSMSSTNTARLAAFHSSSNTHNMNGQTISADPLGGSKG